MTGAELTRRPDGKTIAYNSEGETLKFVPVP
jgi:hypothetical protein